MPAAEPFPSASARHRSLTGAFLSGAAIGVLGGLIGLGGAEFRLPLLISLFGFVALQAVILNKAMSLIVVAAALPARLLEVPFDLVADEWHVIVNLLAGSLIGSWLGASWAVRMTSETLYRVIAALLVVMAVALLANHFELIEPIGLSGVAQAVAGVVAGLAIGAVAALLGVAGGELLIPTIVLLFAVDVKLAGSLSLAISLPTMIVAFARYSRDGSFAVLRRYRGFALAMAVGSILGALLGAILLGVIPGAVVVPALAALLLASSVKIWRHQDPALPAAAGT